LKLFKLGRKKRKKKKPVTKEELKDFLTKIDAALINLFNESRSEIRSRMKKEAENWLNDLETIDPDSFKAGVCYAVYRTLKLIEKGKEGYVV